MFSQTFSKQSLICNHLESISKNVTDTEKAEEMLGASPSPNKFIIGTETKPSSPERSRYFQIYFNETRTDQFFVQFTPIACFRSGYLKIDQHGLISLTDDKFKPYRSSKNFYFDNGMLKSNDNWDIEKEERLSSKCVKGLLSLGLFSVAVVGVAYAIASEHATFTPNGKF